MSREKRIYTSETRHAQAVQTRSRILHSAKELFQSESIDSVTIEKIAQAAQVSAPTIYALFKSKRGILRAIIDEALPSDQFEALVTKAKTASAKELLLINATIARQMYDAERAQMDTFWGASILTPEFKELEKEREKRRHIRQEESIKTMEKSLTQGLSISKARDIVWAFTGRDMYRLFVVEQGWTANDYEKWLGETLVKMLLDVSL